MMTFFTTRGMTFKTGLYCRRTPRVSIDVEARIPERAGLGGSSADAGATLRALAARWGVSPLDPRVIAVARRVGADVAFFLNNGNTTTPSEFFFKGFMQATGASGKPDAWFDAGDDAKIQNMAGVWAHVGVTYDAGTSTITLYHNGGAVCDRVLKDGAFGPMTFDEVSGICLGAFPSQVGLGSGAVGRPRLPSIREPWTRSISTIRC